MALARSSRWQFLNTAVHAQAKPHSEQRLRDLTIDGEQPESSVRVPVRPVGKVYSNGRGRLLDWQQLLTETGLQILSELGSGRDQVFSNYSQCKQEP